MIKVQSTKQSFDEALWAAKSGDTITLEPGVTYTTQGPWAFEKRGNVSVPSGVTIIATDATIRLEQPVRKTGGADRPDHDLPILWCGDEVTIKGGTWDCNYQAHPGWFAQGIRFFGRFTITDAAIVGMSGSRKSGTPAGQVESFAISSQGRTGGSIVQRVVVDRCKTDHPDDYLAGIFIGSTVPSGLTNVVEYCDVDVGPYGQFAAACNEETLFRLCRFKASKLFYNDTGHTVAVLEDCEGEGSYAAISFASGVGPTSRRLVATGCDFKAPRLVEWLQSGAAMTGAVTVANSTFEGEWAATILGQGTIMITGTTMLDRRQVSVDRGSAQPSIIACPSGGAK